MRGIILSCFAVPLMIGCATAPTTPKLTFDQHWPDKGISATIAYYELGAGCAAEVKIRNSSTKSYGGISIMASLYSPTRELVGTSTFFLMNGLAAGTSATLKPDMMTVMRAGSSMGEYFRSCPMIAQNIDARLQAY